MAMLDVLLDSYIKDKLRDGVSAQEQREMRKAIYKEVLDDSIHLIEQEKLADMDRRLQAAEARKREDLKRKRLAVVIFETILLAIFIGLFVNQLTNLIDTGQSSAETITICLAGILLMVAALVGIKRKEEV